MAQRQLQDQLERWYCQWTRTERLYEAFAQRNGLTMTALSVMRYLLKQGPCTQRVLCQGIGCPKQTISSLVKMLEAMGFVRRTACQEDRRSVLVALTEAGCSRAEHVLKRLQQAEEAALTAMGAEARAAFLEHNEALTRALERVMQHGEGEDERTD